MTNKTVIIDGAEYRINDPYIQKDVITGEYIHTLNQRVATVHYDLILTQPSRLLTVDLNNSDSIDYFSTQRGHTLRDNVTLETELIIKIACLGQAYALHVKDKETFCAKWDLVPGVNNPELYFRRKELAVMDMPKPYRKFDNTYYKQTIEQALGRKLTKEDLSSPDVAELSKSILKTNFAMGVDSPTHLEMEGIKKTFGVEIETAFGRLERDEVEHLNVKAVHDGSLRDENGNVMGGEYVTGVLYGDAGLAQLHELCRVLQTKCTVNDKCGVHVHVGNIKWNKEDVVFAYALAELIEKELFTMLPKSRRSNSYCRQLTPIAMKQLDYLKQSNSQIELQMRTDEIFNQIFYEVSSRRDGEPGPAANKSKNHPQGSKCGYDKSAQRYCWLNFVTLMYNTKGIPDSYTLEFRPHSATLNYTKIKNWIKICVAFVSFVENHKSVIRNGFYTDKKGVTYPLSLELIVKLSYPKGGDKLIDYIRSRKSLFTTSTEKVDYVEKEVSTKKTTKEVLACA